MSRIANTLTVIAARNEADNIASVVRSAWQYGGVLVVDNASTDDTADIAFKAGADVIKHAEDTHIAQSYIDGFRYAVRAKYEWVLQMDAGGSHDPTAVHRMLNELDHADVTATYRMAFMDHPRWRIVLTKLAGLLIRCNTGMPYRDPTSGFRAYRATTLERLDRAGVFDQLRATAHAFQFELLYWIWRCGYRVAEVPVIYRGSRSSLKPWVVWEALRVLVRL